MRFFPLAFIIALTLFVVGLTMYRASCVVSLREQIESLQQENITLRSRLMLYRADPETQSYLDGWYRSQAVRMAEHEKRLNKLEGGLK